MAPGSRTIKLINLNAFYNLFNFQRMNSTGTSEKRYMAKNQRPSKVLLVCVYDTVVFEITHEIIKQKFQKFGNITKLLIFDKAEVTKFFIEYQDLEQAISAKKSLDGVKLYDTLCKMSIYFSNFTNVDIKHEEVESPGFYSIEPGQVQQFEGFAPSSGDNRDRRIEMFGQDPLMHVFGGYNNYFTPFQRSKTDNPRTLQNQLLRFREKSPKFQEEDELDHNIKQSIDSILGHGSFLNQQKERMEKESKLKIKEESNPRSSVLFFSYKNRVKPHLIYNLFSNFGNLSCVIIKKENIYIKFRSKQFAAIVSTYLNNTVLADNLMALKECPELSGDWKPTENQFCEAVYYDASYDRFTHQRSITINPPSNTLHVSSMKKQICRQHILRDIFEEYGDVDKVHILQQSNERNMALVKFLTVEDSFNGIANLHNQNFSGRKMQISFTKSKI